MKFSAWMVAAVVCVSAGARVSGETLLSDYAFRTRVRPAVEVIPIPAVDTPPEIDGDLSDRAWEQAFSSERFTWGGGRSGRNGTRMWLARDDAHLYIAFENELPPGEEPSARYPEGYDGGGVWGDECVDVQMSGDGFVTKAQFVVSAAGASYTSRNADGSWAPAWSRATRVTDGRYTIEMAIPFAALRMRSPEPGHAVHASFNRADRSADQLLSFTEPYGDVERGAVLVLGTREAYEQRLAAGVLPRDTRIALHLDRDEYPSFERQATGRVMLSGFPEGGSLHRGAELALILSRGEREIALQRISPVESGILDFDLPLTSLTPGVFSLEARVLDDGELLASVRREFFVVEREAPARSGRIPITVPAADGERAEWPLTFGVPFAWGALDSTDRLALRDAAGAEIPLQADVVSRWSREGTVRWALIDAVLPVGREPSHYSLVYGPDVERATPPSAGVRVDEDDETVTVSNGPLRLTFRKTGGPGLDTIGADFEGTGRFSEVLAMGADGGPVLVDEEGVEYLGARDEAAEVTVEDAGPVKATVRVSGWHVSAEGRRQGRFILRYVVHAGLPMVRVHHTFIITASSNEATAGIGSETRYRSISHVLPHPVQSYVFGTPTIHTGTIRGDRNAWLLQFDDVTCRIYDDGRFENEAVRAEGWMSAGRGSRWMTVSVSDFWQQFPKEFEVSRDRAVVHFWPRHGEPNTRTGGNLSIRNVYPLWFAHAGELLDFKIPEAELEFVRQDSERHNWPHAKVANAMGLAKTHEMMLHFHSADWETARTRTAARVLQSHPTAVCDPGYVSSTGVFGLMAPREKGAFDRIESAVDEAIACIFRQQAEDRDYGMFNFGDSHHNWQWQERRWNLHRIWRNTHHGWTRWPWLMYARTGRHDLFTWGVRNARRAADVGHVHHTSPEFEVLPYPGHKIVGGLCDYKGFVHWASGGRFCYNSAADALLHHHYFTGDRRSRDTALAHGRGLIESGRAHAHREGSGRLTSAAELYFHTWDNDYLDFLRRTADALLGTQREDGSFPQWENFAPFLQRYVELTGSPRGRAAMARWGDSIVAENNLAPLHHAKINILAHAYLYTGDAKYLPVTALRVNETVDHVYRGEDPRYRGIFIHSPSNMAQSYFMQEFPYYIEALRRHGAEPEPAEPETTTIRTLSRETVGGESMFVFRAFIRRGSADPLSLPFSLRGSNGQAYRVEAQSADGGEALAVEGAAPDHLSRISLDLALPAEAGEEFEVRVISDQNFFIDVPISLGMPKVREVYPILPAGTWIGGKPPVRFNLPEGTERFRIAYHGRAWPLKALLSAPCGEPVGEDEWIGSNAVPGAVRRLGAETNGVLEGWSFRIAGYGQGNLVGFEAEPAGDDEAFHFAFDPEKLFLPAKRSATRIRLDFLE